MQLDFPWSLAAEGATLGSMFFDKDVAAQVMEMLSTEAFYDARNRLIFDAYKAVAGTDPNEIDAVLVRNWLESNGKLDDAGGVPYLARILDAVPHACNGVYYAGVVREKWTRRRILRFAGCVDEKARDESGQVDELVDWLESEVMTLADTTVAGDTIEPLSAIVMRVFDAIEARATADAEPATGLRELDNLLGRFAAGDMVIVAARPSMGKTMFALNVLLHWITHRNVPVALFSIETSRDMIVERLMGSLSSIPASDLRCGHVDMKGFAAISDITSRIQDNELMIDDSGSLSPLQLRARLRRMAGHGVGLAIVDYLQLMEAGQGRFENRQQEMTYISRHVKGVARELDIPILVLSQLNRAPAARSDFTPRLSDLRESGSIEQDADIVLLLHRKDYYHRHDPSYVKDNLAHLIIAKHRNGPVGVARAYFRGDVGIFEPVREGSHYE